MKILAYILAIIFLFTGFFVLKNFYTTPDEMSGAPPYDASGTDFVTENEEQALLRDWKRPEGPVKVALQVGHWKTNEVPEELHKIRNNTGASGGGKSEWEVNYTIAEETKRLLEAEGITVELLPTTIPPAYWADVFIAIHADGNEDPNKSGFKAAIPRRDYTGKGNKLLTIIEDVYGDTTGLQLDPNVTRNMRGYYAFSWWRYEHAVHPMTTSLILETGFLTSPEDRKLLISNPDLAAEGIAKGVLQFIIEEQLIQ
jgi:hypothetical protein